MDNKIKLLVIGLGVLATISLIIAFQLNLTNGRLQERSNAIEAELTRVNAENQELNQKIAAAASHNQSLTKSLDDAKTQADSLKKELSALEERLLMASNERDSLIDKVQGLIDDKRLLQEELDAEKSKKPEKKETTTTETDKTVSAAESSGQQAYWAEVLRKKANAEIELEQVKSQLKEISYKANELMKERDALKMDVKGLTQEREDLTRQAAYNEKLAHSLSEDLVREKEDKEAILEQLKLLRQDASMMRSRIKELNDTKTTLYKKLDDLERQRIALQRKLQENERVLKDRIDEVVKIRTDLDKARAKEEATQDSRTVELSPIIVQGEYDVAQPLLTGKVLSVNSEHNFVVLDLGNQAKVAQGSRFGVYRDDTYIATVEVIQLRDDISAADIVEVASGQTIKAGDIVKLIK